MQEVLNGAMRAADMVKQILTFSRNSVTEKNPSKFNRLSKRPSAC